MRSVTRDHPVVLLGGLVSGLTLLASVFVPWTSRGAGSSLALRELADFVLSGIPSAVVPRWAGVGVYLVPAGAAVVLIGAGLGGRVGSRLAVGGLAASGSGVLLGVWAVHRTEGQLAGGPLLAAVGLVAGVVAIAVGVRSGRRAT